ncbi:hypothetical protein FRC08_004137 [Ceratobasidium sp. 394]|nr:hypothetical protein FRC08_004137 [Ceratobasidium sp. 394]
MSTSTVQDSLESEFVRPVGSQYQCTICRSNRNIPLEPMSRARITQHIQGKLHKLRAEHEQVRLVDLKQREEEQNAALIQSLALNDSDQPALPDNLDMNVDMDPLPSDPTVADPPPPPPPLPSGPFDTMGNPFEDRPDTYAFDSDFFTMHGSFDPQGYPEQPSFTRNRHSEKDPGWGPYPDRAHILTHSLFNAPHIHFSVAQRQAVLDWANAMGMLDVPTIYSLERCQEALKQTIGDPSSMYNTSTGNVYYLNSINTVVQQEFSNPRVREHMEFYPQDAGDHSSEIWHGEKLVQGHNRKQLTPMVSHDNKTYFVDEICELADGSAFIPDMFLRREGGMWARGYHLTKDTFNSNIAAYKKSAERVLKPLSEFRHTCVELLTAYPNGVYIRDSGEQHSLSCNDLSPNPLRSRAAGRPIYSVPFIVFVDDVSGNKSKQWNKHWCCYISDAALPREQINRRRNIRFMCTTQHASPMEMMSGICKDFSDAFNDMVPVWDAVEQREVLVRPYMLFLPADNLMQAEECSSTGLRSNVFCRTCKVGGPQKHKQSDIGYSELFQTSELRTASDTIKLIEQQYDIAFTSTSVDSLTVFQRGCGIKDAIAQPILERIMKRRQELQKANRRMPMPEITQQLRSEFSELANHPTMNPLLKMEGLDIHIDTPTEILHTLLLGITKYLWVEAVHVMDKNKRFDLFCTRLRSVSMAGLNTDRPIPNYICTNRGSLNGKHFKILVQTIAFCFYGLIPDELRAAWYSLSHLMVLAWYSSIDNLAACIAELENSIQALLHDLAKCAPNLLVDKGKVHLLVHMPLFVLRFGPLLGPDTERFESFNSVFRECSVHSNRQAPSRDIAAKFAEFDRTRHVLSGGHWFNHDTNTWETAGAHVLALAQTSPFLINILGCKDPITPPAGTAVVRSKAPTTAWAQAELSAFECPPRLTPELLVRCAVTLQTQCGDKAAPGSHVAFWMMDSKPDSPRMLGRIHAIWAPQDEEAPICVLLHPFNWGSDDSTLGMPAVSLRDDLVMTTVQDILGVINLQHRCDFAACTDKGQVVIRQERRDTSATQKAIQHTDDVHFVVNTHSMHNYKLITELLHGRFSLQARLKEPAANCETRNKAAQQLRRMRQKENTESRNAGESLAPEVSSAGHKKRKRQELTGTSAPESGNTAEAGPSSAALRTSAGVQPAAHQLDNIYAPPVYPEMLPFGWRPIWSFEHGRFYFHHFQTGATTWETPHALPA